MTQVEDYPAYLDAMEVGEERTLRSRIERLETELATLRQALDDTRRAKRILHVTGADLDAEVVRFVSDDLHLPVRAVDGDGSAGKFWLLAEDGAEPWCLGDIVASADGNVTKEHVALP